MTVMREETASVTVQRMEGLARGGAVFSSECRLSSAEDTMACSHEEKMRGRECSDSEGGCRGVKCERLSVSEGQHMD